MGQGGIFMMLLKYFFYFEIHSFLLLYRSGFIFILYERDFMSHLHKSKRYELIDMFNDTYRYLDDIFIIDNPDFDFSPDIYPTELQLNKANTL